MKISKLFHWLYATLMFLPLVFFIPSCLYYSFNEHATNTETTTINYKYQSNEVNTLDDLVIGNLYHFELIEDNLDDYWRINGFVDLLFVNIDEYKIPTSYDIDEIVNTSYEPNGSLAVDFYFETDLQVTYYFYLTLNNDNDYWFSMIAPTFWDTGELTLIGDFIWLGQSGLTIINDHSITEQISMSDYNVIESVSVNTDDTITDKLNRSWNAIFDLPMFSWTKTTFVSGAFVYISGLFGVQPNNPLNYLFAYFVSISICWLVFDVLLYVPNLAHRWLDKGAIE